VQDIRHARGVVLVHLATERLDEIAAGHTLVNREDSRDFTRWRVAGVVKLLRVAIYPNIIYILEYKVV
jgi:hypothetical protein